MRSFGLVFRWWEGIVYGILGGGGFREDVGGFWSFGYNPPLRGLMLFIGGGGAGLGH